MPRPVSVFDERGRPWPIEPEIPPGASRLEHDLAELQRQVAELQQQVAELQQQRGAR